MIAKTSTAFSLLLSTTKKRKIYLQVSQQQHQQQKNDDVAVQEERRQQQPAFTQADLVWKLRPPQDGTTPVIGSVLWFYYATMDRFFLHPSSSSPSPAVVVPSDIQSCARQYCNGQAVLEAHLKKDDGGSMKKIGRFGITIAAGPPAPPILETVDDLDLPIPLSSQDDIENIAGDDIRTGAIIYMFVEPEYRGYDVGTLALDMIRYIQAHGIRPSCTHTVLVVDDNGSGKLVKWYEQKQNGSYKLAPKLQSLLGSPDGIYGKTMIRSNLDVMKHRMTIDDDDDASLSSSFPPDATLLWW